MEENKKEYQKAIDYLCEKIKLGQIKVGDKVPTERALSQTLKISRNSTREALRSLENMGIISSRQGSGNYYTGDVSKQLSQTIKTLIEIKLISKKDICSFRRMTEKALCRQIIENPNANLDFESLEDLQSGNTEKMIEVDRRFHYQLIEKADNRFWLSIMNAVVDVYRTWIDDVLRSCEKETAQKLCRAHLKIQKAVKEKNISACEKAIDEHYDLIDSVLEKREF